MMTINTNNQKKALQSSIYTLDVLLSNSDISLEEYYTRVYPIEYELECLNDIY